MGCFDTPCPRCGQVDGWGEFTSGAIILKETDYFKVEVGTCCPGRTHLREEDPKKVKTGLIGFKWSQEAIDEYFPLSPVCPCGISRQDCDYHK